MNLMKFFQIQPEYADSTVHQLTSTKDVTVPLALNNGKVICANEYNTGDLQCPGCNQVMYFRKQHKRRLSSVVCSVRCTFVHAHDTACESYEHKTAKKILASTLYLWTFTTAECSCGAKQTLQYGQTGTEEAAFGRFRLDVGVIKDENIIGCIEIYKTHRVDKEKKLYLDSKIEWVEVKAIDVLQAFQDKSYTLTTLWCSQTQCALCKGRKREKSERDAMFAEEYRMFEYKRKREKSERDAMFAKEYRMFEYNEITALRESTPLLTFGKHKGQSVAELSQDWSHFNIKDFWYVRYLAGYAGSKFYHKFHISKKIRETAQSVLEGSCIICEGQTDSSWKLLCTECWQIHRYSCLRCGKELKKNYSFCWDCKNRISQ